MKIVFSVKFLVVRWPITIFTKHMVLDGSLQRETSSSIYSDVYSRGNEKKRKLYRTLGPVRLNTRCHLLAFAAKVKKQLQAAVSIQ